MCRIVPLDRGIITILSSLYCHFTAATLALRQKSKSRVLDLPDDYGMYSYSVERASLVEIEAYRSWTKWGSRTTQTVFPLLSASTLSLSPFQPGILPLNPLMAVPLYAHVTLNISPNKTIEYSDPIAKAYY